MKKTIFGSPAPAPAQIPTPTAPAAPLQTPKTPAEIAAEIHGRDLAAFAALDSEFVSCDAKNRELCAELAQNSESITALVDLIKTLRQRRGAAHGKKDEIIKLTEEIDEAEGKFKSLGDEKGGIENDLSKNKDRREAISTSIVSLTDKNARRDLAAFLTEANALQQRLVILFSQVFETSSKMIGSIPMPIFLAIPEKIILIEPEVFIQATVWTKSNWRAGLPKTGIDKQK